MATNRETQTESRRAGGRPRTSTRKDRAAKLDARLIGMGEMIARARGIPIAEYLSESLRPVITKDYVAVMRELERQETEGINGHVRSGEAFG